MRRYAADRLALFVGAFLILGPFLALAEGERRDRDVALSTTENYYAIGDPVGVRLTNRLDTLIFLPADAETCAVVSVEVRDEAGVWRPVARCDEPAWDRPLELPAGATVSGELRRGSSGMIVGPFVGHAQPVEATPGKRLSPAQREQTAGTVPEGYVPPGRALPPLSALPAALGPGTYRLVATYALAAPETTPDAQRAISEPFEVTDG